jgi:hypothetical protein
VEAFAIEVSHHVRRTVMDVSGEFPENVVVVVPRELALEVVRSADLTVQQNLMLDAEVYISAQPALLWLAGDRPVVADEGPVQPSRNKREAVLVSADSGASHFTLPGAELPTLVPVALPPELKSEPLHDVSPQGLETLQEQYRDTIEKMTREQKDAAHLVPYAPPAFIQFKKGTYLQLSMASLLEGAVPQSQYAQAALAFDHHISPLVRPIFAYFKDPSGFDGINFSTTVKSSEDKDNTSAEAVEFRAAHGGDALL